MKLKSSLLLASGILIVVTIILFYGNKITNSIERRIIYSGETYFVYYERSISHYFQIIDVSPVDIWLMTNDKRIKILISELDMPSDLNEEIYKNLKITYEIRNDGGINSITYKNSEFIK